MIIFTNRNCEMLNINVKDIKNVKREINDLSYEVTDGKDKYVHINWKKPIKSNEYPMMLVVDKKFRHIFNKLLNVECNVLKNTIIINTLLHTNEPMDTRWKELWKAKIRLFANDIVMYFKKMWLCGVLNKKIKILKNKDFFNYYNDLKTLNMIIKTINKTHKKVVKINKQCSTKYDFKNSKEYIRKWIELADKI